MLPLLTTGSKDEAVMTICALRACPSCGGRPETVDALREVGRTPDGAPVLELQRVFACTSCEWIRSVKGENYRRSL